ncbi:hypothetical protein AAC387_Pa08g1966 [Persea americana]
MNAFSISNDQLKTKLHQLTKCREWVSPIRDQFIPKAPDFTSQWDRRPVPKEKQTNRVQYNIHISLRHPRKDWSSISSRARRGESSQAATANVFEKQAFGFVIIDQ